MKAKQPTAGKVECGDHDGNDGTDGVSVENETAMKIESANEEGNEMAIKVDSINGKDGTVVQVEDGGIGKCKNKTTVSVETTEYDKVESKDEDKKIGTNNNGTDMVDCINGKECKHETSVKVETKNGAFVKVKPAKIGRKNDTDDDKEFFDSHEDLHEYYASDYDYDDKDSSSSDDDEEEEEEEEEEFVDCQDDSSMVENEKDYESYYNDGTFDDEDEEVDFKGIDIGNIGEKHEWDWTARTPHNWNQFPINVPKPSDRVLSMSVFSTKDPYILGHADFISSQMMEEINKYPGMMVKPHGKYASNFLKSNENIENFSGHCFRSTIYSAHGTDGECPLKAGSTSNVKHRFNTGYVIGTLFLILLNLDFLPMKLDKALCLLFNQFCLLVINDENVPDALRSLFDTTFNRHGHSLGVKKAMIRQLVEIGCQNRFGLPQGAVKEFLVYDDRRMKEWRSCVDNAFDVIIEVMMKYFGITDASTALQITLFLKIISSWDTFYSSVQGKLSTLRTCTQAVNGLVPLDWHETNTLPWPARPNAKNNSEAFSTEYTEKQKRYGRRKVRFTIRTACGFTILMFDQNQNPLFPNWGLDRLIVLEFGFIPIVNVHDGEIRMYLHPTRMIVAFVHRPYCIGGDSRICVPLDYSVLRNITNQIMIRIGRWTRGGYRGQTFPDENADALLACFFFIAIFSGLHLNKRVASAYHRDALTPDGVYPCKENSLPKTLDLSHPIAWNNRRIVQGTVTKAQSDRRARMNIIVRGVNLCISFQENDGEDRILSLVRDLEALFRTKDVRLFCKRWGRLFERIIVAPELFARVKACRKKRLQNQGNPNRKGAVLAVQYANDAILDNIIGLYEEDPDYQFWLHNIAKSVKSHASYDENKLNDNPVFQIGFDTLRNHFDHSKKTNNEIKKKKMKKAPPHLTCNKVRSRPGGPAITNGCLVLCCVKRRKVLASMTNA